MENQILFSSLIALAPGHVGKWYLVPFFEPTYIPVVRLVDGAVGVAVAGPQLHVRHRLRQQQRIAELVFQALFKRVHARADR